MTRAEIVASEAWLHEIFERHRSEASERDLQIHLELDPRFRVRPSIELARAVDELVGFVLATIPDGCELFVASTKTSAPVARLGSGTLTLRWQVAGAERPASEGNVRSIRPVAGGAASHLASRVAQRVGARFEGTPASLELFAAEGDRELWARVTIEP